MRVACACACVCVCVGVWCKRSLSAAAQARAAVYNCVSGMITYWSAVVSLVTLGDLLSVTYYTKPQGWPTGGDRDMCTLYM